MLDACNNIAFLRVVYFIKQLLNMAFILIPIALILILTVDFAKNVMANEDDMKKNLKIAIKRLIYAVAIFLVPFIVRFAIENFVESDVDFLKCYNVSLDSIKEQIKQNKKECESKGIWDPDANECLLKSTAPTKEISYSNGGVNIHNSSSDGSSSSSGNEVIDKAIAWAKKTAKNDKNGYSQPNRLRRNSLKGVEYDCSSFVSSAYHHAGAGVDARDSTSGMIADYRKNNFKVLKVGKDIKVSNSKSLKAGDVMLKPGVHTELYIGDNKLAGAHLNYDKKPGDSSGKEINIKKYSNDGWNYVLRYKG